MHRLQDQPRRYCGIENDAWECLRDASLRKIPAKLRVRGPHVHAHSLTIHTHAGPSNNPNVLFPAEAELSACLVVVVSFVACGSRQRICFVNRISGCYWGNKRWPLFAFPAEPGHMFGLFLFFNLPATKTSFSTTQKVSSHQLHGIEGVYVSAGSCRRSRLRQPASAKNLLWCFGLFTVGRPV